MDNDAPSTPEYPSLESVEDLFLGDGIEEGDFSLKYDLQGDGCFYFECSDGETSISQRFERVVTYGPRSYGLDDSGGTGPLVKGLSDRAPTIESLLFWLATATGDTNA